MPDPNPLDRFNRHFPDIVRQRFPGDDVRPARVSLIGEGAPKKARHGARRRIADLSQRSRASA